MNITDSGQNPLSLYTCVYYVCMYIFACWCTSNVRKCTWSHVGVHGELFVYMCVSVHSCMLMYMIVCLCTCERTELRVCACKNIWIHVSMCVCIHAWFCVSKAPIHGYWTPDELHCT